MENSNFLKVFLTPENKTELICIACNKHHQMDMSKYLQTPNEIKLKVRCKCGHTWRIIVEKRKFFRKKTNLRGKYKYQITGKEISQGYMTVVNISRQGLKLKVAGAHHLKDGDWIEVEFHLDNQANTLVNRIVNVKNVSNEYIGTSFREMKSFDPVIGFYMLQHTPSES